MLKKGSAYCLLEDGLQKEGASCLMADSLEKGRRLLFIVRQSPKKVALIVYWQTVLKKGGAYCLLDDSSKREVFIFYWKTVLKKGGAYCLLEDSLQIGTRLFQSKKSCSYEISKLCHCLFQIIVIFIFSMFV